jgi:hypothetical protein
MYSNIYSDEYKVRFIQSDSVERIWFLVWNIYLINMIDVFPNNIIGLPVIMLANVL